MPEFRPSDEGLDRAREILERERRRLAGVVDGELALTGASSLPGALTGGDVDLHLRVDASAYETTVSALRTLYDVVRPEIWTTTLATFGVEGEDVGIAVTPIGSEHERRFTGAWRRLASKPDLLEQYNHMKRMHQGGDEASSLAAKRSFFDRLYQR
ncbi:MAG: hypothetical protein H0U86_13115 [Chloroflexi bacterium]|nr:hypothetical protein [Chloroflexota bacterium]